MTVEEFEAAGPERLSGALLALWWDRQGNWQTAHEIAQEIDGAEGAWVHAYLHRKQGEAGNAAYWYRRAGRVEPSGDSGLEWAAMVRQLLG
ncbi:MAG: hypothetical protein M3Y50_12195 [Acidobacteriota bacterium]|nr:hypothetical protein [Acidobacteriota bacterium]